MKKTRVQSFNNIRNSINAISGAYTVKLIDKLYDENGKQQDMQDLYFAIAALFDTNRIPEAMHLIRGLFAIAKMNYPYPIAALEPFDVAQVTENWISRISYLRRFWNSVRSMRRIVEEDQKNSVIYGNPRSKSFHHQYYKELLQELGLPDIRFHALRSTITTILMKNNFNLKGISKMLGHASEIISADVYGDTQEIIEDCLDVLEPFILEVISEEMDSRYYDYSYVTEIEEYYEELMVA